MAELKAFVARKIDDGTCDPVPCVEVYLKSDADKVIEKITEGAISMFRCSESCRGLDLKSPLGKIANIAFKHWNHVELIQNKNTQLQKDKERLQQNNHHLLDEIKHLKEKMERRERYHKYKRCLAMAERCKFRMYYLSAVVDYESSKLFPNPTAIKRYTKKESRMDYWKNRWLELADQFKQEAR